MSFKIRLYTVNGLNMQQKASLNNTFTIKALVTELFHYTHSNCNLPDDGGSKHL